MLYVGLDVHSRQSSLCILNSSGGTVNQVQVRGSRSQVVDRLRQLDQPFSICYEASCGYGHRERGGNLRIHVTHATRGPLRCRNFRSQFLGPCPATGPMARAGLVGLRTRARAATASGGAARTHVVVGAVRPFGCRAGKLPRRRARVAVLVSCTPRAAVE